MSNPSLFIALPRGVVIAEIEELLDVDLSQSDYNDPNPTSAIYGSLGILKILPEFKETVFAFKLMARPIFFEPYQSNDWGIILTFENASLWNDVRNAVALSLFWRFHTKGAKSLLSWWMNGPCFFYSRDNRLFLNNRVKSYIFCMNKYDPSVEIKWTDLPDVGNSLENLPPL